MRFKYYLRGAGLGILLATLVLMVAFQLHREPVTEEEIVKRASELGMVWGSAEETQTGSEQETESETQPAPAASLIRPQPAPAATGNNTTIGNTANTGNSAAVGNNSAAGNNADAGNGIAAGAGENPPGGAAAADTPSVPSAGITEPAEGGASNAPYQITDGGNVVIIVEHGEVCRSVAEKLAAAGIVADAEEFRIYMGEKNYAGKLHAGEFEIPGSATFEEIAQILIAQ